MSAVHAGRAEAIDAPATAVGTRFAGLEGYRGLAALGIVVYHVFQSLDQRSTSVFTDPSAAGYRALFGLDSLVSLFFVLSAFLLSLPYVSAALQGLPAPSGRAFLFRRAARVVPLYAVAILVVWSARNPVVFGDWIDLAKHLTFVHVYDQERIFYTIGPAWSLAVEVQFYVLLAIGGWAATRLTARLASQRRLVALVAGTAAIGAASVAWKAWAAYVAQVPGDAWPVWFGLPAKLDAFALGIGLAIAVAARPRNWAPAAQWLVRLGGVAVVIGAFAARPADPNGHVWFHTVAAVGFVLVLASSVMGPADAWVRALSSAPLAFLGLVSYSLYLWHEPVMLLLLDRAWFPSPDHPAAFPLALAIVVPAALAVAWVSYHLLEEPLGKLRGLMDRQGRSRDYYSGE